ncbi:MAG: hypothetical protein BalsKO_31980 [Balneolaceae bacterium]
MNKGFILLIITFFIYSCSEIFENKDLSLFKETPVWRLAKAVNIEDVDKIESSIAELKLNIDYQEPKFGFTVLHFSVIHERFKSTQTLLELGANPNLKNTSYGTSPFIEAAAKKKPDLLHLFLKYDAEINAEAETDEKELYSTPLIASITGGIENVFLLVEAGANVDYKTKKGDTALNRAFLRGEVDIDIPYYLLFKTDADIDNATFIFPNGKEIRLVERMRDWTFPLESYEHKKKMEIASFLKEKGQDYWSTPIPKHLFEVYPEDYLKKY